MIIEKKDQYLIGTLHPAVLAEEIRNKLLTLANGVEESEEELLDMISEAGVIARP